MNFCCTKIVLLLSALNLAEFEKVCTYAKRVKPKPLFKYPGPLNPEKGQKIGSVDKAPLDYELAFDITPVESQKQCVEVPGFACPKYVYTSILHFTTGEDQGAFGSRYPALFFIDEQIIFLFDHNIVDCNLYSAPLKIDQTYRFLLTVVSNKYTVYINGNKSLEGHSNKGRVQIYDSLKIYSGNPWYPAANVVLSNISYGAAPFCLDDQEFEGVLSKKKISYKILPHDDMMMQNSAADYCAFPLVNSVYCPLHYVSRLVAATHEEAKTFGGLVDPSGGGTLESLAAGYAYLYDGIDNPYNNFKTYPGYTATSSEILMCYKEFYGSDYAPNDVVKAALDRQPVEFIGPALTQDYSKATRTPPEYYISAETAKKINQYTTALLEMYQLMEKAVQEVKGGCISYVNKDSGEESCQEAVDIWDNAAAVQDGPNYLGTKRCQNYLTCGWTYDNKDGNGVANIAIANHKVLNLFQVGQNAIHTGDIVGAKGIIKLIQSAQLVSYIQGVGYYAYQISDKCDSSLAANNKEYAAGSAFATGMLPQLYKCNRAAAIVVDKRFQLKVGNEWGSESFKEFMDVIRAEYQCLGITCEDVGGLWDGSAYYADAEPCVTNYGDYFAGRF